MAKTAKGSANREARERAQTEAVCESLAAELEKLVGFRPHVEPVHQVCFRRGAALSVRTVEEIVIRLRNAGNK